ncbi:hypothetical protein [Bradymonas sediminis]|nr:hypothetical protein [Bradymonas sediminis]
MMTRTRYFLVSGLFGLALASSACGSSGERIEDPWPTMSALPAGAPADLESGSKDAEASASNSPHLRSGNDGFLYVSGLDDKATVGRAFLASYGGTWPVPNAKRPVLAAGRLVELYEGGVGLVHITYQRPNAALDGLRVTWTSDADSERPVYEPLGKALGHITELGEKGSRRLTLSVGKEDGVRKGDFYALLADPLNPNGDAKEGDAKASKAPAAQMLQLSRRLTGVCMIKKVSESQSECHRWSGSGLLGRLDQPVVGQEALFLEHTFGAAPRKAVIQVARVQGGDEATQAKLSEAMHEFLGSLTEPTASVETIANTLDASASDFYRIVEEVERRDTPQVVIGAAIRSIDGEDHLIVNYGGLGSPAGPGMVAAPPVGGVDLGPVGDLNPDRLRSFSATVWASVLIYRGQTSEALLLLDQMINTKTLTGPLRWHARDQYAMRWGALGHYRESLWLVLQDEAVAAKNNDRTARLNAMGTRVRLYDFLELPEVAVETAKAYLDERAEEKPDGAWRSALAMYAEMLTGAEKTDQALAAVEELEAACPDTCNGDLSSFISGVFWRLPSDQNDARKAMLKRLEEIADDNNTEQIAGLRLYQGLMSLRADDHTQGLIAFLEAERLYKKAYNLSGQARALYFASVADMGRGEPQSAYERALEAQKIQMELNDFTATAEIFKHLSALYTNPDFLENPGPFLGGARQVLAGAVEAGLSMGDLALAGESLLSFGSFQLKIGMEAQASDTLNQAAALGMLSANFDLAALAHLYNAAIARQTGDMAGYQQEVLRAKLMAELSKNPAIIQAVEEMMNPEEPREIPTQLL